MHKIVIRLQEYI